MTKFPETKFTKGAMVDWSDVDVDNDTILTLTKASLAAVLLACQENDLGYEYQLITHFEAFITALAMGGGGAISAEDPAMLRLYAALDDISEVLLTRARSLDVIYEMLKTEPQGTA